MSEAHVPRRTFLADSARVIPAAWLTVHLPWLTALASCARDDAQRGAPLIYLTAAEERALNAFAAQIIPGAESIGAVQFIDRAFGLTFFANEATLIRAGLADLDARARSTGAPRDFASVSASHQVELLRTIEHTPFFSAVRTLVVIGTFADPKYGGNRNGTGWSMVGIDYQPMHTAPFGWYDARHNTAA